MEVQQQQQQQQQQNSISLQMSSPKHMDVKVNSNIMPFNGEKQNHTPTRSYFESTYQMLSSSPNSLNKMNLNSYSLSPVKKNSPLVKLMDGETVQTTSWNNYSNVNNNYKESSGSPNSEKNIINNFNTNTNFKDVFHSVNNNSDPLRFSPSPTNHHSFNSFDNNFIDIKAMKNKVVNSSVHHHHHSIPTQEPSDFFMKKSIKNHFENKTKEKGLSQLSSQLSKVFISNNNINDNNNNTNNKNNNNNHVNDNNNNTNTTNNNININTNTINDNINNNININSNNINDNINNNIDNTKDEMNHFSEEKKENTKSANSIKNIESNTKDTKDTTKLKSLNNFKSLDTETIADIVFKKQEVHEAEKMHANAKSAEKIELQKSLYSCQLSLSPKEKMLDSGRMMSSSPMTLGLKKSLLTKEDFESTKVIKENARKMLLSRESPKQVVRKQKSVKFSGENEECPFKRFEAPVSMTTSPIFLVNSTIKPFLEIRCNLTTFTEFKQRMIIKKPILIEKAGLLIEEKEKSNGHLASFIKNTDVKKEHGVFKSRPSHVPYGPSTSTLPLFATGEKDKIRVVIQVQNLAYHKEICVRYTFNNWLTSKDISAKYLNSLNVTSYISKKFHDSTSIYPNASTREKNTTGIDDSDDSKVVSQSVDRFVADIDIPSYMMDFMEYDNNFFNRGSDRGGDSSDEDTFLKSRRRYSQSLGEEWDNDVINKCTLKFAAFYRVNGQEYWENNNNLNYTMDISRVLYIPTKKVYMRSRTPEIIKSRMVNFTDAFYNTPKSQKKHELKSILKTNPNPADTFTGVVTAKTSSTDKANEIMFNANENQSMDKKLLAKFELREKCIRETIQKELSGTVFLKQLGVNPTILNTIINSNRVSTRNNILKMLMYYQRKAGITQPVYTPSEKETLKAEVKN
ncbi:hypothetical protein BCR36DRAFT_579365 [Piromyces finnis]|uniref:CBM21 domain-containing protein n=1 Tax=Piromyces finnis TaxID=1754191 RepID=A0A1Y1VMB8_9FUNG|nr:hypothetical protein BCR36DRAFT_579365 [Piromyces finnis]|eukprot:ORX59919.1 hypothetical protein BCR36DRAFT_579365 [Piromyces finnis]